MKYLIPLAIIAAPAFAGDPMPLIHRDGQEDYDTATLTMEGLGFGTLVYDNSVAQRSRSGDWTITEGQVTCDLSVIVRGPEEVRVNCRPPYAAEPPVAQIEDGEKYTFHILFIGG